MCIRDRFYFRCNHRISLFQIWNLTSWRCSSSWNLAKLESINIKRPRGPSLKSEHISVEVFVLWTWYQYSLAWTDIHWTLHGARFDITCRCCVFTMCSYVVLDRSLSMAETGYMKWDLCLVLLLAWTLCCLGVIKGVKSTGKVHVYSTASCWVLCFVCESLQYR